MRSELVYGPDGTITGIRHAWTFDDMFSAFATQGIDSKQRGVFTREELEPLAKTNVESLKDFDYFTIARVNGKKADFVDPPSGYYLEYKDQILTLHFILPFKTPVKAQDLQIEIYDPSYFVDFSFEKDNAVALVGAPAGCKLVVARPEELDAAMAAKLFQMSPDQKLSPSEYAWRAVRQPYPGQMFLSRAKERTSGATWNARRWRRSRSPRCGRRRDRCGARAGFAIRRRRAEERTAGVVGRHRRLDHGQAGRVL